MKTYSFNINNTKKNNKKFYTTNGLKSSFSKILDTIIASNVIENNPYLIDSDIIAGKTNAGKTAFIAIENTPSYDNYTEFLTAMNYLANLEKYKDTYNFELEDGTPVKIFDDEIQIGFDLLPINKSYSYKNFLSLTPKTTKTIIDIYIKLNN